MINERQDHCLIFSAPRNSLLVCFRRGRKLPWRMSDKIKMVSVHEKRLSYSSSSPMPYPRGRGRRDEGVWFLFCFLLHKERSINRWWDHSRLFTWPSCYRLSLLCIFIAHNVSYLMPLKWHKLMISHPLHNIALSPYSLDLFIRVSGLAKKKDWCSKTSTRWRFCKYVDCNFCKCLCLCVVNPQCLQGGDSKLIVIS